MGYSFNTIEMVNKAPKTLGTQVARAAIRINFPVTKVAKITGASRQTIYNWFTGGGVLNAYKQRMEALVDILENSNNEEEAWSKACTTFNLQD